VTTIYPNVQERRAEMKDAYLLPEKIYTLYQEVLAALWVGSYTLAAGGLRAIVEATCVVLKIRGDELTGKISKLQEKGYISQKEADRLHAIRFMGNDSLHQMRVPDEDQVIIVLEITEHLLDSLFLLDMRAKEVRLETVISDYKEFLKLLKSKLKAVEPHTEISLKKILGLSARRLDRHFQHFEEQLIEQIKEGSFPFLTLGENKLIDGQKKATQLYTRL